MYLAKEIDWDGERHDMVGLVPGSVRKGQIRVVSYVSGTLSRDCLLGPAGSSLLGHEFHHSELVMDEKEKVEYAITLDRGTGIQGGSRRSRREQHGSQLLPPARRFLQRLPLQFSSDLHKS